MLCPLDHLEHVEAGVEDEGVKVNGGGGGVTGRGVQVNLIQRLIPSDDDEHRHHAETWVKDQGQRVLAVSRTEIESGASSQVLVLGH